MSALGIPNITNMERAASGELCDHPATSGVAVHHQSSLWLCMDTQGWERLHQAIRVSASHGCGSLVVVVGVCTWACMCGTVGAGACQHGARARACIGVVRMCGAFGHACVSVWGICVRACCYDVVSLCGQAYTILEMPLPSLWCLSPSCTIHLFL
jgi:hypothetical protein